MTPLAKETVVGLRKNQNLKTDLSPDPNPVEVLLKIVSIVVQVTNVDNAQPMGKIVRHVCGKKNHFAKKCRSGKGQSQSSGSAKHKSF